MQALVKKYLAVGNPGCRTAVCGNKMGIGAIAKEEYRGRYTSVLLVFGHAGMSSGKLLT